MGVTPPGPVTLRTAHDDVSEVKHQELYVFGDVFDATPMLLPVRGHLDAIKRLLKGDLYIGRGSGQRSLPKSRYCNTFKVSQYGRVAAIAGFRDALISDRKLHSSLWTLSGRRLVCHCRPSEACHGDVLIEEFQKLYPRVWGPELHERNRTETKGRALMREFPGRRLDVAVKAMASRSLLRAAGRLVVESIHRRNPGNSLPIVIGDSRVIMALSSCWCHLQCGTSTSAPSIGRCGSAQAGTH